MRIDVSVPAWDAAALALSAGNHDAAAAYITLATATARSAGMAGDDATSTDFAAAYGQAAQTALDALADLVDGFGTLSRLTRATLDHHRHADQASTIGCADRTTIPYDPADPVAAAQIVTVARRLLPSSRGGETIDLSGHGQWILDQIQGFCWPNAAVSRLRGVATAWASAADRIDDLTRHCATAGRDLSTLGGPEIPVALRALTHLDAHRGGLAAQLRTIGRYCTTYADDVEQHRHQIIELVAELLATAAIVEGIGLVLGTVTAGLTTAGATALNAARIAQSAPKVLAILEAQTTLARLSATGLDLARTSLLTVSTAVSRLAQARVLTYAAHAVAASTDVGLVNPAPLPPLPPQTLGPIDLCEHEGVGGAHTIRKHVGQSDQELLRRLAKEPKTARASSFPDLVTAERAVDQLLQRNDQKVRVWLSGTTPSRSWVDNLGWATGRSATRTSGVVDVTGVKVWLVRDPAFPEGYRVQTAFPRP